MRRIDVQNKYIVFFNSVGAVYIWVRLIVRKLRYSILFGNASACCQLSCNIDIHASFHGLYWEHIAFATLIKAVFKFFDKTQVTDGQKPTSIM